MVRPEDIDCGHVATSQSAPVDGAGGVCLRARSQLAFGTAGFLDDGSRYVFLEVNPNGQQGWLDTEGKHGLLTKIISEGSPLTACHPIPSQFRVEL